MLTVAKSQTLETAGFHYTVFQQVIWVKLVRRTSCSQVVQVYLQPCRRNSFLKCALQPKIEKNTKTLFWRFKVIQGHRYWLH